MYFVSEDTTRMAKLQAGEVDLVQGVPFNMVKMIESSPNFKAVKLATKSPNMSVMFSTRNPNTPWHDKRVRLAMAYAIDCDAIIKNVLHGIPTHWPFLAPGELGYDTTVKTYPYDPKKAKQLLAEAGYPNGFELTFSWQMGGRVPMSGEVVQAVASYLEAVGIRTKLEGKELAAYFSAHQAGKKPTSDFVGYYGGGMAGSVDPTESAFSNFSCDGASSLYCNPAFDKILTEARATMDDSKRSELVKRLVKILQEEVPTILIFNNVAVFAVKKNIDFKPTQDRLDAVLVKDITVK
jgi:peptide/nickel transport system substrate-binding protein